MKITIRNIAMLSCVVISGFCADAEPTKSPSASGSIAFTGVLRGEFVGLDQLSTIQLRVFKSLGNILMTRVDGLPMLRGECLEHFAANGHPAVTITWKSEIAKPEAKTDSPPNTSHQIVHELFMSTTRQMHFIDKSPMVVLSVIEDGYRAYYGPVLYDETTGEILTMYRHWGNPMCMDDADVLQMRDRKREMLSGLAQKPVADADRAGERFGFQVTDKPLSVVADFLSKRCGRPIAVSDNCVDEVITLDITNVTDGDVLVKICADHDLRLIDDGKSYRIESKTPPKPQLPSKF